MGWFLPHKWILFSFFYCSKFYLVNLYQLFLIIYFDKQLINNLGNEWTSNKQHKNGLDQIILFDGKIIKTGSDRSNRSSALLASVGRRKHGMNCVFQFHRWQYSFWQSEKYPLYIKIFVFVSSVGHLTFRQTRPSPPLWSTNMFTR